MRRIAAAVLLAAAAMGGSASASCQAGDPGGCLAFVIEAARCDLGPVAIECGAECAGRLLNYCSEAYECTGAVSVCAGAQCHGGIVEGCVGKR